MKLLRPGSAIVGVADLPGRHRLRSSSSHQLHVPT